MTAYTYDPHKPKTAANFPLLANQRRHFYPTRRAGSVILGVNHITAGLDDFVPPDSSANGTIRYGRTVVRPASWHGIVDSDTIQDCIPDDYTAFVNGPGFNSRGLGLEIGKGTTNWDAAPDWWVEAVLRNAAAWWAPRAKRFHLPLRYVTSRAEVVRLYNAGKPVGFTDHYILDPKRRSDPGLHKGHNTFPRDRFLDYVEDAMGGAPAPPAPPHPGGVVVALQRELETTPDGKWGAGTDRRAMHVRGAAQGRAGAFDVKLVQSIVDTPVDGAWGPKSRAALAGTVKRLQRIFGVTADGAWGPKTEAAFAALRKKHHKY